VDQADRDQRHTRARELAPSLADQGVVGVATSFVDNAGISRVKAVPVAKLADLAAWGAGFSTAFDYFRADDWVAAPRSGEGPVGDQRIVPDLGRLVVLAAQSGWAWAPGDRYEQDGKPHPQDSRLLLKRLVDKWAERGVTFKSAFEIEWVISAGNGGDFVPAAVGPAYGLARLGAVSDYGRDLLEAFTAQGIRVEQLHPEYAPGQFEISVAAESPVHAADTSVLARATIRAVGTAYGFRTSFSPKVDAAGVGNGGHLHVSPWRDGDNLMAGGSGRYGMTPDGESFAGGVLAHLPALLALGAPSVVSYLRLVPQHWAGAYACWGLENREAALRLVTGSTGSEAWSANLEVKCVDLHANPYLLLAGVLAAGADATPLPEPVDVDPASLDDDELSRRGVARLPTTLGEALDAFLADQVLAEAFGAPLVASIVAVRESELEELGSSSPEQVTDASRWAH
jgi:glutamine synthetase